MPSHGLCLSDDERLALRNNAAFIVYYEEVRYKDTRLEPQTPGLRAQQNGVRREALAAIDELRAEVRVMHMLMDVQRLALRISLPPQDMSIVHAIHTLIPCAHLLVQGHCHLPDPRAQWCAPSQLKFLVKQSGAEPEDLADLKQYSERARRALREFTALAGGSN